ncbi:hypothetical protein LOD99_12656 [Oopsacas minuta]|uniref:Histone acetyltransferase n=1 Tax=Oopsacas minuta TaxID=111878 RepID=A0AAV7JDJ3_9METZ|nr:hypothetical protein LOD99_12656 [Oopsacas minuta]
MDQGSSIITRSATRRSVRKIKLSKSQNNTDINKTKSNGVSPTSKHIPKIKSNPINKQKHQTSSSTTKIQPTKGTHSRLISPYIWRSRLNQLNNQLSSPPPTRQRQLPRSNPIPSKQQSLFREAQMKAKDKLKLKCSSSNVISLPFSLSDKHISEGPLPEVVVFERNNIKPSFPSPYPLVFSSLPQMFLCPKCFQYFSSSDTLSLHLQHCSSTGPPGTEIYRQDNLSFFEVDGELHKRFCQNLCLLSKLFLDHKTIYRDVSPFLFYLLYQWVNEDGKGPHWGFIGYFSKEKLSDKDHNLSCIMVLPQHLRKGYGNMLIEFSYLLSRHEEKQGSPEQPLSDLGLLAYRSYWRSVILDHLISLITPGEDEEEKRTPVFSVKNLSVTSGVRAEDLISTMQYYGLIKYWKSSHVILVEECSKNEGGTKKRKRKLDPVHLVWNPTEWVS